MQNLFSENGFERSSKAIPMAAFRARFDKLSSKLRDVLFYTRRFADYVFLYSLRILRDLFLLMLLGYRDAIFLVFRGLAGDQRNSVLFVLRSSRLGQSGRSIVSEHKIVALSFGIQPNRILHRISFLETVADKFGKFRYALLRGFASWHSGSIALGM